jgi:glycosyltransferase involved in cell wall biosynthesis
MLFVEDERIYLMKKKNGEDIMENSKPQILIVSCDINVRGGITTHVNSLLQSNLKENYQLIHIATHVEGTIVKRIGKAIAGYSKLLYHILKNKPNLVHIHSASLGSFFRKSIAVLITKIFNIPVLFHVHGGYFDVFYHKLPDVVKKYVKWILSITDFVIVLSEHWKNFFSTLVNPDKIEILHYAVTLPQIVTKERKDKNAKYSILFLGRVLERKGAFDLIKSIPGVLNNIPTCEFIFAGDGDVNNAIRMTEDMRISQHTKFLGWIKGKEKEQILRNSDLSVLPSYIDCLPNSLLEAMSYGVPVISTPVGGIPDVLEDGVNGFIVPCGDTVMLSKRITDILKNYSLFQNMSKNNYRKIAQNFNTTKIIEKLRNIYNSMIANQINIVTNNA